jgi:hypothetical protein
MHDDRADALRADEPREAVAGYTAPALIDLGSFEELTQLSGGSGADNESAS